MEIKTCLIIASYAAVLGAGWQSHTWYDDHLKSEEQKKIISDIVDNGKNSNDDAEKTEERQTDNREKARKENDKLESNLAKPSPDCIAPDDGVLILREAVTTHTRAR